MKYLAQDGRTAEMMNRFANAKGQVRVVIGDTDEQMVVDYDDFIKKFNSIAKDGGNSLDVTTSQGDLE